MPVSIVDSQAFTEGDPYTPAAGSNRLVVISGVGESAFSSRQIESITMGGATFTQDAVVSDDSNVKGGVWFLKEADIPSGSNPVVVDWGGDLHNPLIGTIYTLENVDQTTPLSGTTAVEGADPNESLDLSITSTEGGLLLGGGAGYNDARTLNITSTNSASTESFTADSVPATNGDTHRIDTIHASVASAGAETVGLRWDTNGGSGGVWGYVTHVNQAASSGPDYTQRKGSTFDVTHGLGTITSATLDGNAITINSTGAGTVNLTDDSGITTSGEYDLVLGDGTGTETYTVQVNVIGLPAYVLNKSGSPVGNLTGIKCVVTATGELDGTELYSANNLTATAGELDSAIFLDTGDVDDPVTVSILTGANEGVTVETTLELL